MKDESYKKKAQAEVERRGHAVNFFSPCHRVARSPRQFSSLILGLVRGSGCVFNLGPTDAEFFHSGSQRAGVDAK